MSKVKSKIINQDLLKTDPEIYITINDFLLDIQLSDDIKANLISKYKNEMYQRQSWLEITSIK